MTKNCATFGLHVPVGEEKGEPSPGDPRGDPRPPGLRAEMFRKTTRCLCHFMSPCLIWSRSVCESGKPTPSLFCELTPG